MKRKMILALLAAMTLTVGSVGTVFAAVNNGGTEIQTTDPEEPEHTHTWGDPYYVIDQEAKYEKVEVIDQEEKWDWVTNIITPAWDEEITEIHTVCFTCGLDFDAEGMSNEELLQHVKQHMLNGESDGSYGSKEVVVDTIHHEAVTKDVWTKVQDKISHFEDKLVTPEKGHWEHTCTECGEIQNSETGEVIKPGTLPENPDTDTPENPDTDTPENPDTDTPENPDTDTPENPDTDTPETPDTDTPETPGESTQTPENDSQNQQTPEDTQAPEEETADKNKDVVQGTEVNQEASQPETSEDTAKKSPKTGDPANFIYLATLAGSALTGGTAFGFKKKFKK